MEEKTHRIDLQKLWSDIQDITVLSIPGVLVFLYLWTSRIFAECVKYDYPNGCVKRGGYEPYALVLIVVFSALGAALLWLSAALIYLIGEAAVDRYVTCETPDEDGGESE